MKYKIKEIWDRVLCARKSATTSDEEKSNAKVKYLARLLVEELDKYYKSRSEWEGVKHVDIYWDYDHMPKREIHVTSLSPSIEFIQELDVDNQNFKDEK